MLAEWNMIRIDGDLVSSAIEKWYHGIGVAGSKKTWVQGKPYPRFTDLRRMRTAAGSAAAG